jgi:hypothetical protein
VLPGAGMGKMIETETNKNNTHPETIWNLSNLNGKELQTICSSMDVLIQTLERVKDSYKK